MTDIMVKLVGSVFRFLKGGMWLPVVLPFFLYKLIFSWHLSSARRLKLQDKVVLITGASSGLGEALAHSFYSAGCKVILSARRVEELERVKGALLSSGPSAMSHHPVVLSMDLSDLKDVPNKARDALNIHGNIDILINNSGVSSRSDVLSTSLDVDLKVMVVNYFGHIALTKAILNSMVQQKSGHIVAISSIQGRIGIPFRSSYAASKHAMQAFFDSLRAEIHDDNIHVTVATLGYVQTNLSINAVKGDGSKHAEMDKTTASGMTSQSASDAILQAVVKGDKEIILAPFSNKLAIVIRVLFPKLFFYLMAKRARNPHKD